MAEGPSLMVRHTGPATSGGCASIQQNEPRSDSTLVSTPWRSIRARWKSTSSKALASGSSLILEDFSTSAPSGLRTMRGSLVRARRASATTAGRPWACISIMVMTFFLRWLSGSLTPRRRAAKCGNSIPQHRRDLLEAADARVHFHRLVEAVGVGGRIAAPAAFAPHDTGEVRGEGAADARLDAAIGGAAADDDDVPPQHVQQLGDARPVEGARPALEEDVILGPRRDLV